MEWKSRIASSMMNIGITWLITVGTNMGIRNFKLQKSQVRERGSIGLNQSLIYTNPCTTFLANFFLFVPLHLSNQKKELFFGRTIFGGAFSPPLATPSNYTDANGDIKADSFLFLYHLKM